MRLTVGADLPEGHNMRIRVDKQLCVGAGLCALSVPQVFGQDDEAKVALLTTEPASDIHEDVRAAASCCPAMAIEIGDI
jgi:ferredoxin